eukprot:gnl/MRDRNA2_/MRDRNA2_93078_c0_seq1.p1 gnl/MRDRNA2_/MRDRNA2_93078_c0~~gnl/MRDRNA2_/MRDRNA2_93078_c0_seq1.p1  ORF type:complete len:480 (+),score=96.70 gnl/MRDRNA2_/MRDRNA2_93078_c0_seq1:131-1441(+)
MGGDVRGPLAFLDVTGLEKALNDVSGSIEDQDKSMKGLAQRIAVVERIANRGQDKSLEEKVSDLAERMIAAEECVRRLESKTGDLDGLPDRVKSIEEKLAASYAELQKDLKNGIRDTRAHFDEQMKRLKNQLSLAEAKVAEASQRFETLRADVEDCALVAKQQGKKLDEVEENALLAVAHGGLISDLRQRQDNLKEVCDCEFNNVSSKLRTKADQSSMETMRSDLEQSNIALRKRMETVTDSQEKMNQRSEEHSKHLEGHDSTLESLHADIQSLRNIKVKSGGASAAGTAHCLSCYGQRTQSPPRVQRGPDGTMYHADAAEPSQRSPQIGAGRLKPPRTAPSIPCATREMIPQASPYEAQRRALASAAEKANWSKTRPGSATVSGSHRQRLSRPSTAQSYHSLNSDRSLPLLERIDFSEPISIDDDGAEGLPPGLQ